MSGGANDSETPRGIPGISLRAPATVLIFLLALTAIFAWYARLLDVDASPARLLPDAERGRKLSFQVAREFRDTDKITIQVSAADVFSIESLAKIDELSNQLWHLDGVSRVVGPTTLTTLVMRDGKLQMVPLMSKLPESEEEAEAVRRDILAHPMSRQGLVAADAKTATITVLLASQDHPADLVARINDMVAELLGMNGVSVSGRPVLAALSAEDMKADVRTSTALTALLALLVAWLGLRTVRGTLIALLAMAMGWIWALGLVALWGIGISLGNLPLVPLLVVIGLAYPLTILARYDQELLAEPSPRRALIAGLRHCRLPLVATATATAIGIGVLLASSFPAMRDFAFTGVVGVACMYVTSLLAVPAAVLLLPPGTRAHETSARSSALETLGAQTVRFRILAMLVGAVILACGIWGVTKVRLDTQPAQLLRASAGETGADPPQTIEVVIDGRQPGSIANPATLQALHDLRAFIEKEPGVLSTWSLLDYMQMAADSGAVEEKTLRLSAQEDVDRLLAFDPEYAFEVLDRKLSKTRLIAYTRGLELPAVQELMRRIQGFTSPRLLSRGFGKRSFFPRSTRVRLAGELVRASHAAEQLRTDQWNALWRAAAILLVAVSILFLSFRVGLIALLLNAGAVLLLFALMGWLGAGLNVVTACLATTILGITVGHTTHYLDASAGGSNRADGSKTVAKIARAVGGPIALAALALAAGFLTLLVTHFPALQWFGRLGCLAIAIAFIANLFVLATRVLTMRLVTIPDVLLMRVGDLHDIPLFEGLRPFQAKIVVLTGRLESAEPGALITRKGEVKSELYVLLNGAADVRDSSRGTSIGTLGRGDVIGEMGLVRDLPRSADVLATETTEYLVLDGTFLNRLRRQYPRIAATVFLNLTKILSDRLERTTRRLVEMQ